MKKYHQLLAILLSMCMVLAVTFIGCSGKTSTSTTQDTTNSASAT